MARPSSRNRGDRRTTIDDDLLNDRYADKNRLARRGGSTHGRRVRAARRFAFGGPYPREQAMPLDTITASDQLCGYRQ